MKDMSMDISEETSVPETENDALVREHQDRMTAEALDRNAETRAILMASRKRRGLPVPERG